MVNYVVSVVMNYAVLCLGMMMSYTEPVVVNHGVQYGASGF